MEYLAFFTGIVGGSVFGWARGRGGGMASFTGAYFGEGLNKFLWLTFARRCTAIICIMGFVEGGLVLGLFGMFLLLAGGIAISFFHSSIYPIFSFIGPPIILIWLSLHSPYLIDYITSINLLFIFSGLVFGAAMFLHEVILNRPHVAPLRIKLGNGWIFFIVPICVIIVAIVGFIQGGLWGGILGIGLMAFGIHTILTICSALFSSFEWCSIFVLIGPPTMVIWSFLLI